jgi:hypothetical protein
MGTRVEVDAYYAEEDKEDELTFICFLLVEAVT